MKYLIIIFFLFVSLCAVGQSGGDPMAGLVIASDIYTPAAAERTPGTASFQANRWKKMTISDPTNADAWLNYFIWTDRNMEYAGDDRVTELTKAVLNARQHISHTYQYHLMAFMVSGKKDSSAVFAALHLADDKKEVYPYIIHYAIINNDPKTLEQYAQRLEIAKDQYQYHYNVLMSAEPNATIYAKGFGDLVPLATLQYRHHVRRDILLKYYDQKIKDEAGAYLALSLGRNIIAQYPKAAYTGLLVKLQPDDGSELKKHVEKDMDLSALQQKYYPDYSSMAAKLNRNYLPSFILLYKIYKQSNDPQQEKMKKLIKQITGGDDASFDHLLNQ